MLMNWAKYTVSPTRRLSKGADTSPQLNKQFTESQQHLVRRRLGIQEYAVLQWFVLETPHVCRSTSMVILRSIYGNLASQVSYLKLTQNEDNLILRILALMCNKCM